MKNSKLYSLLAHVYMSIIVIAFILLFTDAIIYINLYDYGISSGWYAFLIGVSEDYSMILRVPLLIWAAILPLLRIICYIRAIRRHYLQLGILVIVDRILIIACGILTYQFNKISAFEALIPHMIIGVCCIAFVVGCIIKDTGHRTGDGSLS